MAGHESSERLRLHPGCRTAALLGVLAALSIGALAHADGRSSPMLVWSGGDDWPLSRTWNGAAWRDVQSAPNIGRSAEWIVVADCPRRKETALLTLDGDKDVNLAFYDGWSWGAATELGIDTDVFTERVIYLAYEQLSGDLLIAYWDKATEKVGYRTWDGSTLSGQSTLTLTSNKKLHYLELISKPDSDEIMLVAQNDDKEIIAAAWSGSAWGSATALEANCGYTIEQPFAFAYEGLSGDGLVAYGEDGENLPRYRTWNGTAWSAESNASDVGKKQRWVRLAADPASDEIIMATLDDDKDLNVQVWNGSSWGAVTEIDDNLKDRTARYYDVAYEAGGNEALIVYGENGADTPRYRTWDGSAWSAESSGPDVGDQPIAIQLRTGAEPGEVFIACTDNGSDLNVFHWDGSSMSANTQIDDAIGGDKEDEPFMIARAPVANLLQVVVDPASLTSEEDARRDRFLLWGYQVNLIDEGDSVANFDTAVAKNHVAYVAEEIDSSTLGTKLLDAPIGVVIEEVAIFDEFGLTWTDAGNNTETDIDILNYSHYITDPFSAGALTICSSTQPMNEITQYIAPRAQRLADVPGGGGHALVVFEAGSRLINNAFVDGRRVFLPFGGGAFAWSALNANGLTLAKRSIEWGRGTMARWKHDESAGTTASDDLDGFDTTLTLMNPPASWVEGRSRRALDFDGVNDRAVTSAAFMPPVEGTIAFWMKVPGAPPALSRILGNDGDWEIRHETNGTLAFDIGLSTLVISAAVVNVPNRWYHIVITYSQIDGTYALYIDGALDNSGAASLDTPSGAVLTLGDRTGAGEYFQGTLDDLRILNHVVEADEAEGLRNTGRPRVVTWAEVNPN